MFDIQTLTIHSERLTLAPFSNADLDLAIELFGNAEVRKYAGFVLSEDLVRGLMPNWIKRGADGVLGVWSITEKISGSKIGSTALLPMPVDETDTDYSLLRPEFFPDSEIEVGYHLLPALWGKGYATEACRRVVQFAFEHSYLKSIAATFYPDNTASGNVLIKTGFKDRGKKRSYAVDGPFFQLTKKDWQHASAC